MYSNGMCVAANKIHKPSYKYGKGLRNEKQNEKKNPKRN